MYLKGITEVSPRYFRPLYTLGLKVGARLRGLLFLGAIHPRPSRQKVAVWYTTLLFLGSIRLSPQATDYMVYTPVISGPHTPNTGIFSSLSCWHHLSHENQLTEHSCFHDDHASPQALIPVIPSVLAFRYLAKSGAAAGVGPAPLCVCCQGQLRCGPHSRWRQNRHRKCRWFHRAHQTFPTHVQ